MVAEAHKGQVLRITSRDSLLEFCGLVIDIDTKHLLLHLLTGQSRGKAREFDISKITSLTEILSCPLFYRLRRNISDEANLK